MARRAPLHLGEPRDTPRASYVDRLGPRPDAKLAVDRPRVAVDRVVREVQLAPDVPLRERPAEHAQHGDFTVAEIRAGVRLLRAWPRRGFESRNALLEVA